MQIKLNNILAALTVAGIAVAAFPANAATTYTDGDLLLSFRATGGTGSTSTLVVNLGQADTVFRDATGSLPALASIGTELAATFGANWATRSDLFWGATAVASSANIGAAVDGDPVRTIYASAPQNPVSLGSQGSTPWTISTGTSRGTIATNIAGYQTSFSGFTGATTQTGKVAVISTSNVNTWEEFNDGTSSFGLSGSVEGNFGAGVTGTALDLYRILNSNTGANPTGTVGVGSWEGTLAITSGGVVSFTSVPEPSRMMLSSVALAGLLFRRRRSVKA